MQIKKDIKFTPELLTEAPRRSPSVPSHDGNYVFFTVSTYSLRSQTATVEIKILNLKTEEISLFSDDAAARSPQWLPGNQILFLKSAGSNTELWIGGATGDKTPYLAGSIDSAIQNVKSKELSDGNFALSFSALQNADGTLHNPATAPKPKSNGREYESILVRNWSAYVPKETSTLFYTTLRKTDTGKYQLSEKLVNALQGTNLEFPGCPIDFIGRSGSYDLSAHGILFVTYDPEIHFSTGHTLRLWYLHIPSFAEKSEKPHRIETPGFNGNFSSPIFSSSGDSAAFIATKNFLDETSYTHIFILETFASHIYEVVPLVQDSIPEPWDISPTSVFWSNNDHEIYIRGKERAREKLWRISVINPDKKIQIKHTPTEVDPSDTGDIVEVHKLGKDANDQRLLINRSSFTDDGSVYILHVPSSTRSILLETCDNHLKLGLNPSQVSEIVFRGAGSYDVQAWVLKPTDFDPSKSYPLAFLVHGGPKFSWSKKWSTSWNPALWAEQGYVVVLPNPSGSDSFGQAFCSAVQGDWGGRAYDDLVKCFEYVETHMPYVDTTRAIAGGYSYGGYMMNYIAGQPLAKKFKTLISHSGIFSLISLLATDLPGNIVGPFGRAPWTVTSSSSSREPVLNQWDIFDPARYTHNWTQPMLITHGEKDFLVPVSQGLAAYNVCRMKRIESRWLSFPDEGHFVGGKENSYLWFKTVLGWANKYAGVKGGVELGECVSGRSGRAY